MDEFIFQVFLVIAGWLVKFNSGNAINLSNAMNDTSNNATNNTMDNNMQNTMISLNNNISALPSNQMNETGTVIFAGDISLDYPIRNEYGENCAYEGLLQNISRYLADADYNMINLEAPFVTKEMSTKKFLPQKGIHNMAWSEGIKALISGKIKGVTIANNHIGDFGADAALYTNQLLRDHGIDVAGLTFGANNTYTKQTPVIKTINGIRIGILAYCGDNTGECRAFRGSATAGTAVLEKETVEADIAELKPQVDVIAVFLHWGTEYMAIPGEEQRMLAVKLNELGVKLIVGSHPHILQGHEWVNDTLIHYSLGNFVFHAHSTFMGTLSTKKDKKEIHRRAIEQSRISRGPASYTELIKVQFSRAGVVDAYFLPVRIHVDPLTFCLYPRAVEEDKWLKICGPEDRNCYAPKAGDPTYP